MKYKVGDMFRRGDVILRIVGFEKNSNSKKYILQVVSLLSVSENDLEKDFEYFDSSEET